MAKTTHRVVVTVTFDRPCTAKHAAACVRDEIHGEFFPFAREGEPEEFRVRGVRALPRAAANKGGRS